MRRALVLVLPVLAAGGCRNEESACPAPPAPVSASAGKGSAVNAAAATPAPAAKGGLVEGANVRPHHEEPVADCPAHVPDSADDDTRLSALLDEANKQIEKASYAAAWTCADRAADLAPQSVEAHHLRGAALAALGRDAEAQLAYSIALSLDPDDPETLRAVADFYVNGKGERGRDALRLGLELAQRGSRLAAGRRTGSEHGHRNNGLVADLELIEGQALDDLGRSDEAVGRLDAALRLTPNRGEILHEKGVALFDLSRFAEAKDAFAKALAVQPEDAYSHQMYGLVLEELGDQEGADAELAKALALAPGELTAPILISKADFQKEIDAVLATLPADRRGRVANVKVEIADLPDPQDLAAVSPPFPPTILGLYRGPVGKPSGASADDGVSIVLYRKNLARAVKTRAELTEQIRDTLLHEIGHLEGLDEDDLRRRGME